MVRNPYSKIGIPGVGIPGVDQVEISLGIDVIVLVVYVLVEVALNVFQQVENDLEEDLGGR